MIEVDGQVYAISYGHGRYLLDENVVDERFGIAFAVRTLRARELHDLTRRRPGVRGRTDTTVVPAGMPIWAFGIEDRVELVRRAGGRIAGLGLTYAVDDAPIRIAGSAGLRIRLGVRPHDLVNDVKIIGSVVRDRMPSEGLEFVERFLPVDDDPTERALTCQLDHLLGLRLDMFLSRTRLRGLHIGPREEGKWIVTPQPPIHTRCGRCSDAAPLGPRTSRVRSTRP